MAPTNRLPIPALDAAVKSAVAGMVRDTLQTYFPAMTKSFSAKFAAMETDLAAVVVRLLKEEGKAIRAELRAELEEAKAAWVENLEARLIAAADARAEGLEALREALASIPVPQVHVRPDVRVEGAVVNLPPLTANITTAPIPKDAIRVEAVLPARRSVVEKSIVYDGGRPAKIVETVSEQ